MGPRFRETLLLSHVWELNGPGPLPCAQVSHLFSFQTLTCLLPAAFVIFV